MSAPASRAFVRVTPLAALGVSAALHVLVALSLLALPAKGARLRTEVVELEVIRPPPPANPAVEPPPPPVPLPPPPRPKPARAPVPAPPKRDPVPPLPQAPPPSSSPPAQADEEPPKPAFGLTPESLTEGPADVAMPVGNTVAMAPTGVRPPQTTASPYAGGTLGGEGNAPFAPVTESFVAEWPRTLQEVRAPYPEEARRLDVSGTVRLRVGIDETGRVREVKVLKRAGHGLDEAAVKAMWRFKFAPAKGTGGQAVPFRINYDYTFTPGA